MFIASPRFYQLPLITTRDGHDIWISLEILSLLCTFENSTKCIKISFDSDSLLEIRPVLKVAPRCAEPSEFRSVLPGSARRGLPKAGFISRAAPRRTIEI